MRCAIILCTNCSHDKDTTASLTLKLEENESDLRYWQDCYETLLQQHFENTEEAMQYYKEIIEKCLVEQSGAIGLQGN